MSQEEKGMSLIEIKNEINTQIADQEVFKTLCSVTFKGLDPLVVKRAIMEGMMRGFKFEDFLKKNVYAIPFAGGYSLVTSIDFSRKIGMRSGVVGKDAPIYEIKTNEKGEDEIISCTVTIKKQFGLYVGDFTATVYFNEFYQKGREYNGKYTPSMWDKKPRTMIAKVAEMHALRMACPEELANQYAEEEFQQEVLHTKAKDVTEDTSKAWEKKLKKCKSNEELAKVWSKIPGPTKVLLEAVKAEMQEKYGESQV